MPAPKKSRTTKKEIAPVVVETTRSTRIRKEVDYKL